MERTGHWTLSEDVDISTKVKIMVDRNELYDIELEDSRMAVLLETLMRKYTGLFSYPVPIDEDFVASKVGVPVPMLRQLLYKLSLEHVIRYVPCDHATVIYLHHDRLRPKNLNLDPDRYDLLKSSYVEKMQKMIDYISEEGTCRSSYLLDYFGQSDSLPCGTCDVCRSGRNSDCSPMSSHASIEDEISRYINVELGGSYTIAQVSERFGSPTLPSSDRFAAVLRRLIDNAVVPPPEEF